MIKFICYPKCSTCIKVRNYLDALNIEYVERNIKEDKLNYEEIKEIYLRSKLPLKKFFNVSGLVYKELNLKDKISSMDEDTMLNLLSSNGMLVKRPIIVGDEFVLVGAKISELDKYFKK